MIDIEVYLFQFNTRTQKGASTPAEPIAGEYESGLDARHKTLVS